MAKVNPADAIVFYRNAISLLCEVGKFGTAGRLQRKLAEWYEEDRNFDECIDQYRQASDYYLGDGMVQQSDLCLLKCAYYQGLMEEFEDSAEIYSVGLRCLDSNLVKFNARDYFLRAGLVLLAAGEPYHKKLKKYLMKFKNRDPSFCYSRECLFVENLIALFGSSDLHVFADHVYNVSSIRWGRCGFTHFSVLGGRMRSLFLVCQERKARGGERIEGRKGLLLNLPLLCSTNRYIFTRFFLRQFDNVSHLDSWCLEMLYELRNQVQTAHEELQRKAILEIERIKVEHQEKEEEKKRLKAAKKAERKK